MRRFQQGLWSAGQGRHVGAREAIAMRQKVILISLALAAACVVAPEACWGA